MKTSVFRRLCTFKIEYCWILLCKTFLLYISNDGEVNFKILKLFVTVPSIMVGVVENYVEDNRVPFFPFIKHSPRLTTLTELPYMNKRH